MLEAAEEAVAFARGCTRPSLDQDRKLTLALLKSIEIIGEAAARVTEETRASCPDIPWPDLIGMRNRLVHTYFEIDLDVIWETVHRDLPPLIFELRKILRPDPK
jgi:uncharacterized protein with HEPN domain